MSVYIHDTAIVAHDVSVGDGTKIWHWSHVMTGAKVGRNVILGQNVFVARDVVIGHGCKIQNNVSLYKGVILEDNVFVGPSVVFTNVVNPRAFIERKDEFKLTIVGEGATIGANATIVCGNNIAKFALVGAGAVVTKYVEPYSLVVGVPAQRTGWVCKCGCHLQFTPSLGWKCTSCGEEFVLRGSELCAFRSST